MSKPAVRRGPCLAVQSSLSETISSDRLSETYIRTFFHIFLVKDSHNQIVFPKVRAYKLDIVENPLIFKLVGELYLYRS